MVSQTMRSLKLPEEMQDNVLKYLQYIHETPDVQQDLDKFLGLLSPALKNQILHHLHSTVIKSIEILEACSSVERGFIVNHLKTLLFLPGDVILRQNEDSHSLYFINRGVVDIHMVKFTIDRDFQRAHVQKYKANYADPAPFGSGRNFEGDAKTKIENEDGIISQNLHLGFVKEGEYFGEIGLLTNLKRTATATSNEYCTLSSLNKETLQ